MGKVSEINAKISELSQKAKIPSIFSPECQAEFDLGFWQEIQYIRKAIKEVELANENSFIPISIQHNNIPISQEVN
jgi:hypothetical protein